MDGIKQRTGGVSDLKELITNKHIEYFAEEHGCRDPFELKEQLDAAYTSSEIFRNGPRSTKEAAKKYFEKVRNGLKRAHTNLEAEPYFASLALRHCDITPEQMKETLWLAYWSVENTLEDLKDNEFHLTNSPSRPGASRVKEADFLADLKRIHKEFTGLDVWVTTDARYETTDINRYRGPFFDFALACFTAAGYDIEWGTLADRIVGLHKKF